MSEKNDNNITITESELPQLFKLMKGSMILNLAYEHLIKLVSGKAGELDFFKDKKNIKYITVGISLFMASSLIGLMSYFLFYVMFFFSSLKCILWLFEHYNPDTSSDENNVDISKHYITEKSPIDVLEYYVVPIFIVLVMHPMAYIPIPFISLIVYGASVMLGLATMTNKGYRQKFCIFIRDLFTNRDSRTSNGDYVPGHEGEVHKLLQTLCYSIECINLSTFHITHSPRVTYDRLNGSRDLTHGLQIVTNGIDMNPKNSEQTDTSKKAIYLKQVDEETKQFTSSDSDDDELDEY